jgi:hypothetical protein
MTAISSFARRVRVGPVAVLLSLGLAACAPGGPAEKGAATAAVSVDEVRERVRQYSLGGGDKDVAGEHFYEWGEAAHPALAELARDPSLTDDELDAMMMIVSVYAPAPELFDALRTRIAAMPDAEARDLRLGLLEQYRATPGLQRP